VHTNTVRDHHADGRRVVRLKPRYNADVNKWWMCDFGRYSHKPVDDPSRITAPMLKDTKGGWIETSWEVALEAVADKIKRALPMKKSAPTTKGPSGVGIWASPQMTNEDLFVLRHFSQKLGINNMAITVAPKEKPFSDNYLIKEDKNPNTAGAAALDYPLDMQPSRDLYRLAFDSQLAVLIICHHDLTRGFDPQHLATALGNVQTIVFIGPNRNATSEFAHILLPAVSWAEKDGTFTNFAGRVQRTRPAAEPLGDARPEWLILKRLGKELGVSMPYLEASDVFAAIGRSVPAFAELTYEVVGGKGAMLKASSS
jgi:predicted molibdopterin-dependent oxidoreductase YjgC